jgi:hypothetical protein
MKLIEHNYMWQMLESNIREHCPDDFQVDNQNRWVMELWVFEDLPSLLNVINLLSENDEELEPTLSTHDQLNRYSLTYIVPKYRWKEIGDCDAFFRATYELSQPPSISYWSSAQIAPYIERLVETHNQGNCVVWNDVLKVTMRGSEEQFTWSRESQE